MAIIKLLVVGGGGNGGRGGGGAGGYQYDSSFDITAPTTYTVTVGGAGQNSVFETITALAGGNGGGSSQTGFNGGCGGGGGTNGYQGGGTGSQGGNGGTGGGSIYDAGGGGGASANGSNSSSFYGGTGGAGIENPIAGSTIGQLSGGKYYICGGGGGYGSSANGGAGLGTGNNTGGGGQGSQLSSTSGNSGVVIISYVTADFSDYLVTGGTITTSGSDTIHTFTSSGTLIVSSKPTVTTQAVTSIDITTATGNGNVTSDGGAVISERGVCWSTSANPTTADSKATSSGTTGAFTASITGLTENTLYYVRAYATNANGTSYGSEVTFTTVALSTLDLVKDISGISGATYAVQLKTNISAGTLTVKLGTTGASQVISTTGALTTVVQGLYGGLSGLIITQSVDFVGTLDDVFWVLVVGDATIDWNLSTLTNLYPVNGSVKFRRVEDKEITRFNLYRYIDTLFKDLDGYITITVTEEANDLSADRSKTFVVGNTVGTPSPFVKKRISILSKNQAIILQYGNNKLNETFTICSYSLTGFKEVRKLYKPSAIISI